LCQERTILGWLNGGAARGGQIGKMASSKQRARIEPASKALLAAL
jgi:hypothetical protein